MSDWFIVKCHPSREAKAVSELRRIGLRAYLPKRAVYHRHKDKAKEPVKRWPALVGYVFIRFPAAPSFFALRQCQGVIGVLYCDGRPYRLARAEVGAMMRAQRSMTYDHPKAKAIRRAWLKGERDARNALTKDMFQPGMQVYDPVKGILAIVEKVTRKGTIKAVASFGKREIPVEFTDLTGLQVVDHAREAA